VSAIAATLTPRARSTRAARVKVEPLGRTDYLACWRSMQDFTDAREDVTPDEIWLTEHDPIYTLGLAGRRDHVRAPGGIAVLKVDRGGQVTYHGPGQVVAYTLVDLRRRGLGIRAFVRLLEGAVIAWLAAHRIDAYGKVDAPGVYVQSQGREAKIAALGLKVRRGCTYHGVAVNIDMDLGPFDGIDPCGYPGLAVTQLADFGVRRSVETAGMELAAHLRAALDPAAA